MRGRKGKSYDIPVHSDEDHPNEHAPDSAEDPGVAGEGLPSEAGPVTEETFAETAGTETDYVQAMDHLRRLQAEFDNYRKRVNREREESFGWAQSMLAEKLLPVLDDFERAISSFEGEVPAALQGFVLIRENLERVLTESGLERIRTEGERFDPDVHEALLTQRVEPERTGQVIAELVPGYTFKGRLVRPARVQVGVESDES